MGGAGMVRLDEGAVTRVRREFKLLLEPRAASAVEGALARRAEPECSRVTSVYFDRPGRPLSLRALSSPDDCLKIRTKEYSPDAWGSVPRVVVEAKRERRGLVQKDRLWVARGDLAALEARGELFSQLQLLDAPDLEPVLAVTYARGVYQQETSWRVTVDREVAFHPVTSAQALGSEPLTLERLGAPVWQEPRVVLEVKHLGDDLPGWLEALRAHATPRYSKFAEGVTRWVLETGMAREA
jgi:hypothetical protein